jgi:starch phosphorylase
MYIVHAKRIHEYKRQLMTILQVIGEYLSIVRDNKHPITPKTYIFAGKAAPSYTFAKLVIKLINNVANVVNNDEKANEFLKVVFIPDYKVSVAEYLIPAADLSCQISTAGFEASGTSNMKFALNASVTVGTYDGANIEIYDAVGADNFYLFGLTEEQIRSRRMTYNPREIYENSEYVKRILNALNSNMFADENYPQLFRPIFDSLLNNDYYFILADLESFNNAIQKAAKDFADKDKWAKKALMNMARIGYFSSDRSVMEYARNIWHVEPVEDKPEK